MTAIVAVLNRSLIIVHATQSCLDWVNAADPDNEPPVSLEDIDDDNTYLVPVEDEADLAFWLRNNFLRIFERELAAWHESSSLWPQDRDFGLFERWFTIDFHSGVTDLGDDRLVEDDPLS